MEWEQTTMFEQASRLLLIIGHLEWASKKNGRISTLLYTQDRAHRWGASQSNDQFQFKKGRYYSVTLYTQLNSSANKSDGEARVYVDGKLLVHHKNLRFWSGKKKDHRISKFLFSTFHGGGSLRDAPKDKDGNYLNVHARFDNFQVSEGLKVRAKQDSPK